MKFVDGLSTQKFEKWKLHQTCESDFGGEEKKFEGNAQLKALFESCFP